MELYTASGQPIAHRRRRRQRGQRAVGSYGRDLWGRAIAGAVIMSGVGVALAAPSEQPVGDGRFDLLRPLLATDDSHSLRVGSLIVTPSLGAAGALDTNVFAARKNAKTDWFNSLLPSIDLQTDLPRHAFDLRAQGEWRHYATYGRENIGNAAIAGSGRIDLAGNAYLLAGGGYQLLHEDRGALVPVQGKSPTQFAVASGKAGIVIEPAPMGLRLDATVDSYAYNNVALFGGAVIPETARDHVVYALQPRVSYQILPQYNAFIRAVVNRRQYNSTREPDALDRSSTGYEADIGSAFGLAGFAVGELYLGFLRQDYDAKPARAITTADFGGNVEWRPSDETKLRLNLSRSVEESAVLGAAGYLQTAVRLGVERQVVPRLRLDGSFGFINADFSGAGGNSDLYELRLGTHYEVATNLSAGLEYDVAYRQSSAALPSYTRQVVELRLRGRL